MVGRDWALSRMLSAIAVITGVSATSWKLGAVVRGARVSTARTAWHEA
jgi:hypothetical protein